MALLETRSATKRFGGLTAVNDLTFDLEEGAIVSVIGPNGAGKTTFFNCIAGFYQIDEGSITLDGTEIHELRPDKIARLGLSRTYQNIRLFGGMPEGVMYAILLANAASPHIDRLCQPRVFGTRGLP